MSGVDSVCLRKCIEAHRRSLRAEHLLQYPWSQQSHRLNWCLKHSNVIVQKLVSVLTHMRDASWACRMPLTSSVLTLACVCLFAAAVVVETPVCGTHEQHFVHEGTFTMHLISVRIQL